MIIPIIGRGTILHKAYPKDFTKREKRKTITSAPPQTIDVEMSIFSVPIFLFYVAFKSFFPKF
jgi:hypothetical protein